MSVTLARRLRRQMSLPERLLWQELRGHTPRIRRQHPLGPYVLDFYCAAARLIIEVDGAAHDMGARPAADQRRSEWLAEQGLQIIRVAAVDVLRSPGGMADAISRMCRTPPPRG